MTRKAGRRSPQVPRAAAAEPAPSRDGVEGVVGRFRPGTVCLILVVATIVAYLPSMRGAFLFDDAAEITNNDRITQLLPLGRFFSDNTRPIASISFAVNYALGGLEPLGYHIVNLLIHILAGITLFGVARRLFMWREFNAADVGQIGGSESSLAAFAIALLWLVHPLQTQAVTYIVQRTESLAALFCLLAIYAFLRAARGQNGRNANVRSAIVWTALAVIACGIGMATKQTALVMPIVILLCDVIILARRPREAVTFRWPMHLAILATWVFPLATGAVGSALRTDDPFAATGFAFKGISPLDYLKTQAGVILHYLRLVVWPHPLCLDYDWPVARMPAQYIPHGLAILCILVFATVAAIRRRPVGFILFSFFILLAPTSSIVPIKDVIFEHRMYLPLAAMIAALVLLFIRITQGPIARRARVPVVVTAAAVLTILTFQRNHVYRDPVTMWADVVAKQPTSARAQNNLGNALSLVGRADDARRAFETAIRLDSQHADARYNLGRMLHDAGRLNDAISLYRKAQALAPHEIESSIMLGNALTDMGDLDAAAAEFERAIANATPRTSKILLARAHFNLANTRAKQNQIDDAAQHYTAALDAKPDYAPAHRGLAWIADRQNRIDDAIGHYRAALAIDPADSAAQTALDALLRGGSRPGAAGSETPTTP